MQWYQLIESAQEAWSKGDLETSEIRLSQALKQLESSSSKYDARLLPTLEQLTELMIKQEKFHAAEPMLHRLLDVQERLPNVHKLSIAKTLQRLAEVSHLKLSHAQAIHFGSRSLSLLLEVSSENHLEVVAAARRLAKYRRADADSNRGAVYANPSSGSLAQPTKVIHATEGASRDSYASVSRRNAPKRKSTASDVFCFVSSRGDRLNQIWARLIGGVLGTA